MAATLDARVRLDSSQYSGTMNRVVRETQSAVGKMSAQFNTLRNVLAGGAVGVFGINIGRGIMEATLEAERLQMAMEATTGSAAMGRRQLEQVRKLAGDIGLEVASAAKAMIQFQSAGMTAGQAMEAIKSGYNAILATGGGAGEFSRFAIAIQQLRNSPKVLQEEINQLREALPTTARLMQEAFGVTRSEDLQKLNISGKEFADTMLRLMADLPQIGDTLGKQIGRVSAKWSEFQAKLGENATPWISNVLDEASRAMDWWKRDMADLHDFFVRAFGGSPEMLKAWEEQERAMADLADTTAEAKAEAESLRLIQERSAASKQQSVDAGMKLRQVYENLANTINRLGREYKRTNLAEEAFEDGMRRAADQERNDAWEAAADATRKQLAEAIAEKRARAGEAFNEFVGPMQMSDDEREAWRRKVEEQGMSRSDRRTMRAQEREERRNTRKAADEQTREELKKAKEEARNNAFDDLKKNRGFFNEEQTKAKLRDQNRKAAKEAVEGAAKTLIDIRDILKTLATA